MARTTGTISLTDLLDKGALQVGERLIIRRRSAPPIEGVLLPDGSISVDNRSFSAPSAAARALVGNRPTDGWKRWRVVRLENKTLAEVRELV